MKLIIGLGNPGRTYLNNRHNVGFQCIDVLSKKVSIEIDQRKAHSSLGKGTIEDEEVVLAKPRTFMNASGSAVQALRDKFKAKTADIIVIYDDVDLPLGKIRIRQVGSAGGHNGIKSIIQNIGSNEFIRIRVGIGPLTNNDPSSPSNSKGTRTPEFVLSNFNTVEKKIIKEACETVIEAVCCIISEGIAAAMNKFN
ncbi:MAG: aminoacyl-tRNA hydrolase [Chloroflexi bacterium]|nr:aminoacyl-tRNA hydrolase [Chloroflexota bacterium]